MAVNLVQSINNFIGQGSPLSGHGASIVRAASKYGVDPRVLVVIAKKESQFGKTSGRFKNNAWGYGVHLDSSKNTFPTWEAGAEKVAKELATGPYYKNAGKKTLAQVVNTYAPPSENNTALYTNQVNSWYRQLGGDPNASVFGQPSQTSSFPAAVSPTTQQQPTVDGQRLLGLLRQTSQAALRGEMPKASYRQQLGVIAQDARKAPNPLQVGEALTAAGVVNVPVVGSVGNPVGSPVAGKKAQRASHQTSGLAGYPAFDYMAPAGTKVGAPVGGTIVRVSGKDPRLGGAPGGPLGYSVYLKGTDGRTYFLTHIDKLTVKPGQKVKQGQQIAVVANGPKSWSSPHVHMGVHG
jgi:murein DD-endopeptidase MepM/ murein hydrolase activator NlpD